MRKILLTMALAICAICIANAQTLHWLTFVDSQNVKAGTAFRNSKQLMDNTLTNKVTTAFQTQGWTIDKHEVLGTSLTPEKCRQEIQGLACGSNDVVICYTLSAGTDDRANSPWPLLYMRSGNAGNGVSLKWMHDILKSKGAKTVITIGVCLKNDTPGMNTPIRDGFLPEEPSEYFDEAGESIFKMLTKERTDYLISASNAGEQTAFCKFYGKQMDLFTCCLCNSLELILRKPDFDFKNKFSYDLHFKAMRQLMNILSVNFPQTPQISKNVETGTHTQTTTTTGSQEHTEGKYEADNRKLQASLSLIADSDKTIAGRRQETENIKPLFAQDAEVNVILNGDESAISTENPTTFLNKLRLNMNSIKIVLKEVERNQSGKITSITVDKITN